jgi:flagellar basal body rod protein FlgB
VPAGRTDEQADGFELQSQALNQAQRQQVLHHIANADTPGYKARD